MAHNQLPVFYNPKMFVEEAQPSPSSKKPRLLVEQWLDNHYPIEIIDFPALEVEKFYLAHERRHVDDILSLRKKNGMQTRSAQLRDSLFYTNSSILNAAHYVMRESKPVAISPTSGFHHAEHAKAMGYCTFNGLMITAIDLLQRGIKKVGILDCDQHYGNGTAEIIEKFGLEKQVIHITSQQDYWPLPVYRDEFFEKLPNFFTAFKSCDILLYQAGADCHIEDPFGGFLTTEQMALRDKIVFEQCRANSLPVVWNLAGGYQEQADGLGGTQIDKVLELHTNTLMECIKVYG